MERLTIIANPTPKPGSPGAREPRKGLFLAMMLLAIAVGLFIGWVDSRPTWDDAGITAGMIFLAAALFGALRPSRAAVWALAVGAWVPLFGIAMHRNFGSLLALAVAFFGAYAGALARKALAPLSAK